VPERCETPCLEDQLIMLPDPFTGLYEFFLEETTIETYFLEHLLAELHHLSSLIHHRVDRSCNSEIPGLDGLGGIKDPTIVTKALSIEN
jgi:hypothetical protein